MTTIEFERKCDEEGLYCVERGRTFPSHANTESEPGGAEHTDKMSAWVKRLEWRVCIANGLARLTYSPGGNGGKATRKQ